ncbi:cytochrome c1 [Vannielia litorea]|uniref:Cytochrome c1 n=1 Tax=Vannielia litorea TaxID=1217970 RepID=A0A1N6HF34_9RHOB|nr:cytochrome c1 [Vannielia litorea]SIO18444.1 ubiquinol-cytochrome c reductase cytochrome c1 subunit [Vannielia litorea]
MRKFAIALAAASLAALPLAAQEAATEEEQPQAVETETPAETAPEAAPAEEAPAEEATTEEAPAEEAPAEEAAPEEAPAEEAAEEAAPEEAPAEEAAAEEAAVEEEHAEGAADAHGADDGHDAGAHAAGHTEDYAFSFEGPFGKYDQNQLQRGLKIYTEICSACHGLRYVSFRSMAEEGGLGYSEDQVRAYASEFAVLDEDNNRQFYDAEAGEFRAPLPSDNFPANMTANAPDLSLMAKARAGFHGPYGTGMAQLFKGMGGAEYIASLMTGYTGKEKEEYGAVFYENTAFPGGWISMAPPLAGGDVEYDDGHSNDLHHEAMDIAAFLMWTAEPKMMQRKETGFLIVGFLVFLSVLLYLTNKRLWAPHKAKAKKLNAKA